MTLFGKSIFCKPNYSKDLEMRFIRIIGMGPKSNEETNRGDRERDSKRVSKRQRQSYASNGE